MRIYFAHPMSDYDTPFEVACRRHIVEHFYGLGDIEPHIVCPNSLAVRAQFTARVAEVGYEASFPFWPTLARGCDVCVGLRLPHGFWGAGVAAEMRAAMMDGRPAFELFETGQMGILTRCLRLPPELVLSRTDTRLAVAHFRTLANGGRLSVNV